MDGEKLTRDEFANAASAAVRGVLDLYAEVDALLRELDNRMRDEGFHAWSVIPGSRRGNEANRILREWKGRLYVRAEGDDGTDDEASDETDDGDEAEEEEGRRRTSPREISQGAAVAFARVRIYRPREPTFSPDVLYGVLANARVQVDGLDPDEPLRLKRGHVRRILSSAEGTGEGGTLLRTNAPVILPKRRKLKARERWLSFSVPQPFVTKELYEIEQLEDVEQIARSLADTWQATTTVEESG